MDRYKFEEKVAHCCGEGSYGEIYKALDKCTGRTVAVKKIKVQICDDGIDHFTLREVSILRTLQHGGVVQLQEAIFGSKRCFLVFEFVPQNLYQFLRALREDEYLSHDAIRDLSRQLLEGLAYCHDMGVMHRDIKPHNILVTQEGVLKIADFGMSRFVTPTIRSLSTNVVTHLYRPPELLLGLKRYSCKIDVWSAACVIAELCSKQVLFYPITFLFQARKRRFDGLSSPQYIAPPIPAISNLYSIFRILGTPNEQNWPELPNMPYFATWFPAFPNKSLESVITNLPPEGSNLLESMLAYDPAARLSAVDALKHSFFSVIAENT